MYERSGPARGTEFTKEGESGGTLTRDLKEGSQPSSLRASTPASHSDNNVTHTASSHFGSVPDILLPEGDSDEDSTAPETTLRSVQDSSSDLHAAARTSVAIGFLSPTYRGAGLQI
ncbi:hypothetical protein I317_07646 [Kwoniella heveanensis CBS 569]|nr:hypothetical protein I317_07646 [Kwoniella heveanensis CBS 569]